MAMADQEAPGVGCNRLSPGWLAEGSGNDRGPVDRLVFRRLLALEKEKALRLQYCFSLLLLKLDGEGTDQEVIRGTRRYAALAPYRLRGTDTVTLITPTMIGVLLIDAEPSVVGRIVERLSEFWLSDLGPGRPARSGWSAGVAAYPWDSLSVETLFRCAEGRMIRAMAPAGGRGHGSVVQGDGVKAEGRGESRSGA